MTSQECETYRRQINDASARGSDAGRSVPLLLAIIAKILLEIATRTP